MCPTVRSPTRTAAAGPGAGDDELISALTLCEGTTRRLDRVTVSALADLERRGVFAERGYHSSVTALGDLLEWERFDARRKLVPAEQVRPRIGMDGTVLPPRLPATAAASQIPPRQPPHRVHQSTQLITTR